MKHATSASIIQMDLPWQQVKGFVVINTMLITIPFRYKPSFVRWYVTIHVSLPLRLIVPLGTMPRGTSTSLQT